MRSSKSVFQFVSRAVNRSIKAIEQSDGSGAYVRRSIGTPLLRNFTPFILLDYFKLSKNSGFSDHPHRGQETVTYMLRGRMDHEDFTGGQGTIGPGDLQIMTAGKGIVHAEIPRFDEDKDNETVEGLQLWIDLPAAQKHVEPRYRDLRATEIPVIENNLKKIKVKIISGSSMGVDSVKDLTYTKLWFLDIELSSTSGNFQQTVPKDYNSLLYILEGKLSLNGKIYSPHSALLLDTEGDGIEVTAETQLTRFILLAGKALNQPIFQQGPFVEISEFQIDQAYTDFNNFSNGFEHAKNWESKISKRLPSQKSDTSLLFRLIRYFLKF